MADACDACEWTAMQGTLPILSAVIVLSLASLLLHPGVQAQTIDSRDTRTFQDDRVQDTRQNPVPISPGEAERLKRLREEAVVPETREQADAGKDTDLKNASESDHRERPPSPAGDK